MTNAVTSATAGSAKDPPLVAKMMSPATANTAAAASGAAAGLYRASLVVSDVIATRWSGNAVRSCARLDAADERGVVIVPESEREASFEHRHRNIQGGVARAAIFGVSDGLTTNISLVLGVAAANTGAGFVRLAGLAGLLAGAFSMAAGEYVSMRAQTELFAREISVEKAAITADPETERLELADIYRSRGLRPELADEVASQLMRNPDQALESHARDELGIRQDQLGAPWGAAASSLVSFGVGAAVPLLPWFYAAGTAAVFASVCLGAVAALAVGAGVGIATGRSWTRSAFRQLAITALAAGIVFLVGRVVGVAT